MSGHVNFRKGVWKPIGGHLDIYAIDKAQEAPKVEAVAEGGTIVPVDP